MQSLEYPAQMRPNHEGGYIFSFRDVPEALAEGGSMAEAVQNAQAALIAAAEFYLRDGRAFPAPSAKQEGDIVVELPLSALIKMRLLEVMAERKIRPIDLARRMGVRPQKVNRILDLEQTTKIDTLDQAFKAINMSLTFTVLQK